MSDRVGAEEELMSDAPPQWSTNTTPDRIVQRLRDAKVVALATHARPDGDAVGSTIALTRALHDVDTRATPVYSGPWPHRFDVVVGQTKTVRVGMLAGPPPIGPEPDVILVVDTGSWSQLAEVRAWIEPRCEKTIIIDHHLHGDPEVGDARLIDGKASAACQIVADICCRLLGCASPADLPADIAEPLYLGLATDTGWFRHSNVTPETLRLAADLLQAGANHTRVFEEVEQSDSPARTLLIGRAIASLELHADGRVGMMQLRKDDFKNCQAEMEDAGGLNDIAMSIGSLRVSALLTEMDDEVTKVSLRSKSPNESGDRFIDVNQVARAFGGGGHAQAAGARIQKPLAEARDLLRDALVTAAL